MIEIALIVAAPVYLIGMGAVFSITNEKYPVKDNPVPVFAAVFWPLVLFILLGANVPQYIKTRGWPKVPRARARK